MLNNFLALVPQMKLFFDKELSCFCTSDELISPMKNFFVASEPQNLSVPIIQQFIQNK